MYILGRAADALHLGAALGSANLLVDLIEGPKA